MDVNKMPDIIIIYDSKTGNTEKAAGYVLEGVLSAGVSAEVKKINKAKHEDVAGARGIIVGSYCMRDRCSMDIDSFVGMMPAADVEKKPGAAFGSYGFSGGQLPKLEALMTKAGISLVAPGVNSLKAPDEQAAQRLRELGKKVAEAVKSQDKN
jgi:flavorubredoxin